MRLALRCLNADLAKPNQEREVDAWMTKNHSVLSFYFLLFFLGFLDSIHSDGGKLILGFESH